MHEIINKEDVKNFLESSPTADDIDHLSKAEIIVLASYLELTVSVMSKPEITQIIKSELFGIHEGGENNGDEGGEYTGAEGGEHTGAKGGEPNGAVGGGLGHEIQMRFGEHLPEGFTPEQYLDLARLNAAQADAQLQAHTQIQAQQAQSQTQIQAQQAQAQQAQTQLELDHQYRMAQLTAQTEAKNHVLAPPLGLTMTSVIPPFTEDNVQDFFVLFEEIATGMGWTRDRWPFMLQTVLTGQGRETYISVESEVRQDYDRLKAAILNT